MVQISEGVHGKYLVLTDRTALPLRCVRTNRPIDEREYHTWNLPWLPLWLKAVMCIAPAFLLFAPYVVRRRCRLQAGISRSVQFHYLLRKIMAGMLILGSLFVPFVFLYLGMIDATLASVVVSPFLFWGGFILLILFTSPLKIQDNIGDYYWLDGCSPEFLASLQTNDQMDE